MVSANFKETDMSNENAQNMDTLTKHIFKEVVSTVENYVIGSGIQFEKLEMEPPGPNVCLGVIKRETKPDILIYINRFMGESPHKRTKDEWETWLESEVIINFCIPFHQADK